MRDGIAQDGLEFLVHTLRTESGLEASMFGFAGRSSLGAGHLAASSLRPFLIGRNALDRGTHLARLADGRPLVASPADIFVRAGRLLPLAAGRHGSGSAALAIYRRRAQRSAGLRVFAGSG